MGCSPSELEDTDALVILDYCQEMALQLKEEADAWKKSTRRGK